MQTCAIVALVNYIAAYFWDYYSQYIFKKHTTQSVFSKLSRADILSYSMIKSDCEVKFKLL